MTLRHHILFLFITLFLLVAPGSAQVDSLIGQVSNSGFESFAGGISGDGRFIVFESRGNLATENPRNADGNLEIFLFDYAQRRIFQITNTKSVYYDDKATTEISFNVRVAIVNTRPVISNDGRWIAFSSNATRAFPGDPSADPPIPPFVSTTNPGSFDGNAFTSPTPVPSPTASPTPTPSPSPSPGANPLTIDGNLEMWLYEIPPYVPVANLSTGEEIAFAELAGGTFTLVSNSLPSQMPRPGSPFLQPVIADDNHDASISDDGSMLAFASTRDLVPCVGNPPPPTTPPPPPAPPDEDNEEIFTFIRGGTNGCAGQNATVGLRQVTKTLRGPISNPIYSKHPIISGDGSRVAFASTGDNPIDNPNSTTNFPTGSNPESSRNEEIFFADLIGGVPQSTSRQITTTTSTNVGDPVNIFERGGRMSRDGRFIAFDSYANLAVEPNGANLTSFGLYLYDTQFVPPPPPAPASNPFRQVGLRSDGDSAATGGDISRYPGFTDYPAGCSGAACVPGTMVLETRMNVRADGTIPTTASEGLNPDPTRPAQMYSILMSTILASPSAPTYSRLAKFPEPFSFLASTQPITSNSLQRMTFNLALSELGTGNFDQQSEVYYYLKPTVDAQTPISMSFSTGATRIPVTMTPTPTPSPTATPTPTPSPSPSVSPTPTPTPVTPPSVLGLAPGMLAMVDFQTRLDPPVVPRAAVGSISRQFSLPIELSGVTVSINGAACGLKSVGPQRIVFVVPVGFAGLVNSVTGNSYPITITNNGVVMKNTATIVPARPDIFNRAGTITPGGRTKLFNVTNTVHTTEPFTVRTIRRRGNRFVPTVLRIYVTGVNDILPPSRMRVRIRDRTMTATGPAVLVEPGIYTFDFELPRELEGAGDNLPVVVFVEEPPGSGTGLFSRLDDTTSYVWIL